VDRDLVEQAQRGDPEAFAVLARTHTLLPNDTVLVAGGRPNAFGRAVAGADIFTP
jgi:hypothetical protein